MAKNRITLSFRLTSLISVLVATELSAAFLLLYYWAASDVTVNDAFAYIFRGANELLNLFALTMAIASIVYAHAYFGKKTTVHTLLFSLASLFAGKLTIFLYNMIVNSLSAAQLLAGALTYLVDMLFFALILIVAVILSYVFAKLRIKSQKPDADSLYSPSKAAFATVGAYVFILIADLSLTNVIPFFIKYSDPTQDEIKAIISDYLYDIFTLPVAILFVLLAMLILTRATGKLKLKQYYKPKTHKE